MAYTVKAGDNWFTIARKVYGDERFAARLRDRNAGVTLSPGVRIKTRGIDVSRMGGGAALAATTPGMSLIGVPGQQVSTGIPGQAPITEVAAEVPEVTPAGGIVTEEEFTARAESYARQMGVETPAGMVTQAPTLGEPITMEALTGAGIGPRRKGGRGAMGMGPISMPTGEPLITFGEVEARPFGMPSPSTMPSMAPTQAEPFITFGEVEARPFGRPIPARTPSMARPGTEYIRPTPAGEPEVVDTTIMPIAPGSPQATALAARWTGLAISEYGRTGNRNFLPNVITTPVALHLTGWLETAEGEDILTVNNLFNKDNLSYTEIEPGVWVKNPEVTYTGGYTGAVGYTGRRYGRGRGARGGGYAGGGGTQYGPRLVQWRIGFGG